MHGAAEEYSLPFIYSYTLVMTDSMGDGMAGGESIKV